jgi:Tfp pilus assembly pilus retraction ATPase PilT
MIHFNHSLAELVRAGEIAEETAYHYSPTPRGLERIL